jgi:ABC-2 type transport system ATP-binding protein
VGYGPRHDRLIESLEPVASEVLELNLEDAFIEYTRGPRRSLPLLAVERSRPQAAHAQAGETS